MAVKVGALGVGVEYTQALTDRISVRGGINGFDYGFGATESGIAYDFDLIWDSLAVAVDFHPRKNPLRVTFGLLSNDNGLEASSRPTTDITVGGNTYTPAEVGTLRAKVGFANIAPFAGFGWDWSRGKRRFGMSLDFGVLSQGSPRVTLAADGTLLGDLSFDADLAAEKAELAGALDGLDFFPFATVGFVIRF